MLFSTDALGVPPRRLRPGFYLRCSKWRTTMMALVLVSPWLAIAGWVISHHRSISAAPTLPTDVRPGTPDGAPPALTVAAGPWGQIELTPIVIEPPADIVSRIATIDTSNWHFPNTDRDGLAERLKTTGLSGVQRESLVQASTLELAISGLQVQPDPSLLLSLTPQVRTALYELLLDDKRNAAADPFRRHFDPANDWFANSGMSPQALDLVRKFVYRRRGLELFSDLSVVLPLLAEEADRAKLFRVLSRTAALLPRLRVDASTDLAALSQYWGKGGRERDVTPLLQSLAKVPGGDRVNVARLLPFFPRAAAFTFPQPDSTSSMHGRFDCHWTTFNFWSGAVTDDAFVSPEYVIQQMRGNYRIVEKPAQLGDVIFFVNRTGQGIHSATYIADDVVFTKNGAHLASPFVFMRLPELLEHYEIMGVERTMIFRRNDL